MEVFGDLAHAAEELDELGAVMMKDETTLHPLRPVRLALPHSRHPDEALRFSRACVTCHPQPKVRYA